jgi:hypothetical protein
MSSRQDFDAVLGQCASDLEKKFAEQVWTAGEQAFDLQSNDPYHTLIHKSRKSRSRADFAWPAERVAVEIQGGTWNGGRHTSGKGYESDSRKSNAALLDDWILLRFTSNMLKGDPSEALTVTLAALEKRRKNA